jgi:hypothetical protein
LKISALESIAFLPIGLMTAPLVIADTGPVNYLL